MPSDLSIAAFVLGAVFLLISLLGGGFKIFGAEVAPGATGAGRKLVAFLAGLVFIIIGFSTGKTHQADKAPEITRSPSPNDARGATNSTPASTAQAIERDLRVAAEQMTAQLPSLVAPDLRMDSVVAGPGLRMTYTVTALAGVASQANPAAAAQSLQKLKAAVCAEPGLKFLMDNGVAITYNMRGADLVHIVGIDVTRVDCLSQY